MREKCTRKLLAGIFALLVLVPLALLGGSARASAASSEGIVVPLYTYPGTTWDTVASVKTAHPGVPIVAVINPNSGPGSSYDGNYYSGIAKLKSAGVTVIGYVHTSYTGRPLTAIQSDINAYKNWYPNLQGIFFDEESNTAGNEGYYSSASSYAKSTGFSFTVGNPGTDTIPSYLSSTDVVIIYENPGIPSMTGYTGWQSYSKSQLGMISFGVNSYPSSWVQAAEGTVGWFYVTNANLPNPYGTVTPYLNNLATELDSGQGAPSPGPSPSPGSATLSVNSVDSNNNAINGYWTAVTQGSSTVQTGFTPFSTTLSSGTYSVSVSDYGSYTFSHWSDGVTTRAHTVTIGTSSVSLTAVYSTSGGGSGGGGTGGGVSTGSTTLSVSTQDDNGNSLSGYYATLQSGASIQSGYSPTSFTVSQGNVYTVSVSDYGSYVFDHWQDGSSVRAKTLTISGATSLIAYMKNTNTPSSGGATTVRLTVNSVNLIGKSITGLWTVITSSGKTTTGYTPVAYVANTGSPLKVTVSDYQQHVFSHWQNGSTNRTITITPTSNTVLTAYYKQ